MPLSGMIVLSWNRIGAGWINTSMLMAGARKTAGGRFRAITATQPVPTRIMLSTTALGQGGTRTGA